MTDEKAIVVFRDKDKVIRAQFSGSIDEAKASLIQQRRRESIKEPLPVFLWGHYTKGNGLLIHGMWIESVLVK